MLLYVIWLVPSLVPHVPCVWVGQHIAVHWVCYKLGMLLPCVHQQPSDTYHRPRNVLVVACRSPVVSNKAERGLETVSCRHASSVAQLGYTLLTPPYMRFAACRGLACTIGSVRLGVTYIVRRYHQ